ncbi:MAG: CrcB family protein [Microbacteriaceae bacterium]|nr:CrcB family protein [Microbacteriaceae bacterium]
MTLALFVTVALAGAAGAALRYVVSMRAAAHPGFPWAVLVVNVAGSLVAGAVLALAERAAITPDLRLILLTGVCGGLTTFSTFSVETIELVLYRRARVAALSVAGNLVLGVGAAALAYGLLR